MADDGAKGGRTDYAWPEAKDRRLIGKRISRLDGPAKATGAAKYTYDLKRPGMLYAKVVRCPYGHARIAKLDFAAALRMPGVKVARAIQKIGAEVQWGGDEVAVVVATSEAAAEDAARTVVAEYEVLPHWVRHDDADAAPKVNTADEQKAGDPDAAFAAAAVRVKGRYGLPFAAHNCMEAHGQICEWQGDQLTAWCSTQAVSGLVQQLAEGVGVPASNVRILTEYMGGGYGSKFSIDRWGVECAKLAREAGAPVKLMLERRPELAVAGHRPSTWADVEVAAVADGTITAWASRSWGSGGLGGSGSPPIPYLFQIPNRRHVHISIPTNTASARAWRAPNHPQASLVTFSAIDDLAAALKMDPLDMVRKNLGIVGTLAKTYAEELAVAERLMDWKKRWHPRGATDGARGPIRHGLGLALHTWGGRGHRSNCDVTLYPDGAAEAKISTQDLGTGTRTVVAIVLAETLGLPLEAVKVSIGDSRYPASGGSGGSTTVGGVSSATRRAAINALDALFAKVAPHLQATASELEAVDGVVRVKAHPERKITWRQAASSLGGAPLSASGANPGPGDLTQSGVGGVQMAEVAVDVDTGVVKLKKLVAVQDCGLIIDAKTTESQVYGGCIMGISSALSEEKLMDPVTGMTLNHDFETYKMAGIADIGEIVVHLMTGPGYDERGVIGVGEPPVVSPGAAIANAVTNALGVRVPFLPLTPKHVLDALDAARAKGTDGARRSA